MVNNGRFYHYHIYVNDNVIIFYLRENWNNYFVTALQCEASYIYTTVYILSWIFIGNYILLNLNLATILEGLYYIIKGFFNA